MRRTRPFQFLVDLASDRRRGGFTPVLRTKMAIPRVLPGEAAVPCGGEFDRNGVVVANGGKDNLRNVAKGAHLGPIQRKACVALVPVGFQMSRQALWLYHHAALKQRLSCQVKF